ncbi:MAG: RHS repeat domain-containing protein [Asticcacaulis sp.]
MTTYDYDEYGHVSEQDPDLNGGATETTTYRYDSLYNLVSESTASATAADGTADARMVTYKYDVLGRKIASMGGIGSAALAAAGTNSTAIASAWATYGTQYSYDLAGRLVAQTDPDSDTTLFYYDGNGRLKYQVGPDGEVSQYGYDVFGEQSDVTRYASFISTSGLLGGDITTALTDAVRRDRRERDQHPYRLRPYGRSDRHRRCLERDHDL